MVPGASTTYSYKQLIYWYFAITLTPSGFFSFLGRFFFGFLVTLLFFTHVIYSLVDDLNSLPTPGLSLPSSALVSEFQRLVLPAKN
jgi:hypothetical protein